MTSSTTRIANTPPKDKTPAVNRFGISLRVKQKGNAQKNKTVHNDDKARD
ncbi:predicted protein [Plenodomus lingam JN3]|uniref:Predicted protein n=1 Tax=Leptosphaeria maculans (strain JN3 / isolate v23.1.3 / race Av1-4-5-6-7-8) TaxID=985895 RepID=E5ACJ5_LEPMJ|nr:predicted protein [Plenodomus lingam JN3]CBY02197.1 predicted protein [Plenodomus lingam JN3]